MIKLISNKPRKGDTCWSFSKAALKEFKEIRIGIDDETDEAVIKTIDRNTGMQKRKSRMERARHKQSQDQNFYR